MLVCYFEEGFVLVWKGCYASFVICLLTGSQICWVEEKDKAQRTGKNVKGIVLRQVQIFKRVVWYFE